MYTMKGHKFISVWRETANNTIYLNSSIYIVYIVSSEQNEITNRAALTMKQLLALPK